jgi:hypothetical protein
MHSRHIVNKHGSEQNITLKGPIIAHSSTSYFTCVIQCRHTTVKYCCVFSVVYIAVFFWPVIFKILDFVRNTAGHIWAIFVENYSNIPGWNALVTTIAIYHVEFDLIISINLIAMKFNTCRGAVKRIWLLWLSPANRRQGQRKKHSPNPDDTGPFMSRPMGLPVTVGCNTAWDRTRGCSGAFALIVEFVIFNLFFNVYVLWPMNTDMFYL